VLSLAMAEALVTVEEVGRALGVSRSTVWRLIQRGALPSVRRGGRRLVQAIALRKHATRSAATALPAFSEDHPIFRLIGAGRGGGKAPGARDKHAILDE
jgi:excisionase family DNA binding protein